MPDPKGIAGYGVDVKVGATTSATTATVHIGGIIDVSPPPFKRDNIDVTSQDSVDGNRDFIPSPFRDNGEISYEMNWVPGAATDELLETLKAETAPRIYTQTYTQVTPHRICTYAAFLISFEVAGAIDDKKTGTGTWKVTGQITWADAA